MSKREFIREHREEINDRVVMAYGAKARPSNDAEREDWLRNDPMLYHWARMHGVFL